MRERLGLAILLITHDVGIVAGVADRVAVMYAGRLVETGTVDEVLTEPAHPYTRALLAAVPRLDTAVMARMPAIPGAPPSALEPISGCPFHPRCEIARVPDPCVRVGPELAPLPSTGHACACHFAAVRAGEVAP
jgi:oligopeptide/dipeptide ABC transporter ATP-binding protein